MNYYLYLNNQTMGPSPETQVAQMLASGQLTDETPCCREGDTEWLTVGHFKQAFTAPPTSPSPSSQSDGRFHHPTYLFRRKIFQFLGAAFHIYDPAGNIAFYSKMKAFKLKEDIRVYTGEDMKTEVLVITARKILDFSSAYDVVDPTANNTKVGALKRKGLKSIIKDEWVFMDANDQEIGLIKEDSLVLALARRYVPYVGLVCPQKYQGDIGGTLVCTFKQNFNPFVMKITLDFSQDTSRSLDRRLGIAGAILLCAIERKQE